MQPLGKKTIMEPLRTKKNYATFLHTTNHLISRLKNKSGNPSAQKNHANSAPKNHAIAQPIMQLPNLSAQK